MAIITQDIKIHWKSVLPSASLVLENIGFVYPFYVYGRNRPLVPVRELLGRVRNVVLMNVYLDLENPGGSGFWVGGYISEGREMGKLVCEQPGNKVDGSCHSKEGSK
jgi:hypothetical protein